MQNTANYMLPTYEATDNANLLDGYNEAMDKIDLQMKNNADAVVVAATAANNAKTAADAAQSAAEETRDLAESANSAAQAAQSTASTANSTAPLQAAPPLRPRAQLTKRSTPLTTLLPPSARQLSLWLSAIRTHRVVPGLRSIGLSCSRATRHRTCTFQAQTGAASSTRAPIPRTSARC